METPFLLDVCSAPFSVEESHSVDAMHREVLARVDTLVVDKTGTLTEGRPSLAAVVDMGGGDGSEALRLAASLERGSEHPLAGAIVTAAEQRGLALAIHGLS